MRNWAYVRNRQADCAYYTLTFFGFHYRLDRTVIKDAKGDSVNGFTAGISIAFDSSKTDEEKQDEVESFVEEKTRICSGWVFGMESALREINKIVSFTPDLNWESPTKWHEKHPNYLEEIMAESSNDKAKVETKISDENKDKQ